MKEMRKTLSFNDKKNNGLTGHQLIVVMVALLCCTMGLIVPIGTDVCDAT